MSNIKDVIGLLSESDYVNKIRIDVKNADENGKDVVDELFIILPYENAKDNKDLEKMLLENPSFGEELYPEAEYPESCDLKDKNNLITNIHYLLQDEFL